LNRLLGDYSLYSACLSGQEVPGKSTGMALYETIDGECDTQAAPLL